MSEHEVVPMPERPEPDEETADGRPALVLVFPPRFRLEGEPPESGGGSPPKLAV